MTPIIKATNIIRVFGTGQTEAKVLKGISLAVEKGELVAITGKSGSGKSTLLYQLSLLDSPTKGIVELNGVDTSSFLESEATEFRLKHLGYVFQDYALLPTLTASENVMMPLLMQGYTVPEAREKAHIALETVGLVDRADYTPNKLSGGQQQRVSIARAIGHDPSILFADEPTANLDSETSDMVLDALFSLNKKGQTIVLVTHEIDYAKRADQWLKMVDGEIR